MATQLMAILNATPDSFYDGNPQNNMAGLLTRAEQYIKEGADILDIGGESTRPGASPVSAGEELTRVVPLVREIHHRWPNIPLSLDTTKLSVALEGLKHGVRIINDVSGHPTQDLFKLVKNFNAHLVLMHTRGNPQTMQQDTAYQNIVSEVKNFLAEKVNQALATGLSKEQLIIDPGFGFAKTREQNYTLLKHLAELKIPGVRLLVGLSRKSFLSMPGDSPKNRLPQTLAAHLVALQQGADILRVHDVAVTRQTISFFTHYQEAL